METGKNKFDTYCVGQTKKQELHSSSSLLIESEFDQLSFAILDKKANQCVGLCSVPMDSSAGRMEGRDAFQEFITKNEVLNFSFSSRIILMANRECVFIPEEVFREEDKEEYIQSSFGDNYSGKCFSFKLSELKNYIVFKVPEWLLNLYNDQLSGASIEHSTAYLVDSIYRLSKREEKTVIHAHFKRSFFELIIFKKGKMLFYNSFSYQTSEDIAYFIMYALKQWNIEIDEISVSGVLQPESDELYLLKKYLGDIYVFPEEELLPYPPALDFPSNFINLLNPSLCE